jgi:hypothetical protein
MKVRILKPCSIKGAPVKVGQVVDVTEARAKALIDNNYAELAEKKSDEKSDDAADKAEESGKKTKTAR